MRHVQEIVEVYLRHVIGRLRLDALELAQHIEQADRLLGIMREQHRVECAIGARQEVLRHGAGLRIRTHAEIAIGKFGRLAGRAAQPDRNRAGRHDELMRHVAAIVPDHLTTGLLGPRRAGEALVIGAFQRGQGILVPDVGFALRICHFSSNDAL
jgi:hypothetical protein